MRATFDKLVRDLSIILINGLKEIERIQYQDHDKPFSRLINEVHIELRKIEKFSTRSNRKSALFKYELETMTKFMNTKLNRLKKIKKRSPSSVRVKEIRRNESQEVVISYLFLADSSTSQKSIEENDDTIIEKFIKHACTLLNSLKALCGKKFEEFFEVVEELFKFLQVELFNS